MIRSIFRSIGVVLAGFITVAALSVITDRTLEATGVFPPAVHPEAYTAWMLALALGYRSIYTIAGGYLTARLAKSRPMRHVAGLMVLGGIGGVAGAVSGWNLGNHWYPVLLAATGPLFVWLGGKLFVTVSRA
ncbi:MAG: hypothetical protein WCT10_00890 [Patescibacteria group bacterium]|jgi:hypothetical protein